MISVQDSSLFTEQVERNTLHIERNTLHTDGEIMNKKGCTKMNPTRKKMLPALACAVLLCLTAVGLVALEKVIAADALSGAAAYYIVREGDTLWDITDHFYEDPYLWPAVWGVNPHISNPHWIYPGDPIYLASIAGEYLADVAPAQEPGAVRPVASAAPGGSTPGVSTMFISRRIADTALLTPGEVDEAGRVLAARDNKFLLGQGDEIYLQLSEDEDASFAGPYQVMRGLREIRHPETGKKMGTLYGILGYASVVGPIQDGVARGMILSSQDAIETGDLVRRGAPPPKEVYSNASKRELGGWIVAGLRTDELLSEYDVVFIDQGIEHGVEVGDTFWVLESARKVKNPSGPGKVTLPDTRMALLVVIHAEQKTSTTLVTNSYGVFSAGHRVRARTE
jgi:hypothetical protein